MSGSLIIVLIIVVWLFVLAPLLLRGQKPIRKAGEAFDDTRVLYEGGSGELPGRRRPRLSPSDVRRASEEDDHDYEVVAAEDDVLLDDGHPSRGSTAASSFKGMFSRKDDAPVEEVVDGDIVHELEAAEVAAADTEVVTAVAPQPRDEDSVDDEQDAVYAYDDSYTSPADLMYPDSPDDAKDEVAEDDAAGALEDAENGDSSDELSEEELEFAERRRGRGGWDPVADAEHSLSRYQRRQRTLIGLAAAVVVTALAGVLVGGWAWGLPAVAVAATALYLFALRNQVRQEEMLRVRRVRQLRRARLGVRNAADDELAIPSNLRRPGAVVLEMDDESPDFEYLPVTDANFDTGATAQVDRRLEFRGRRFGDTRRAG